MPTGMAFWGFLTSSPGRSKGSAAGLGTTPWHVALWGPGPSPSTTDHDTHKPRDSVLGLYTDGRQGRLAAFSREHAGGPGARPGQSPGRRCFERPCFSRSAQVCKQLQLCTTPSSRPAGDRRSRSGCRFPSGLPLGE